MALHARPSDPSTPALTFPHSHPCCMTCHQPATNQHSHFLSTRFHRGSPPARHHCGFCKQAAWLFSDLKQENIRAHRNYKQSWWTSPATFLRAANLCSKMADTRHLDRSLLAAATGETLVFSLRKRPCAHLCLLQHGLRGQEGGTPTCIP